MDWTFHRVLIHKLTGWTFDVIDKLNYQDVTDLFTVLTAIEDAKK